MMEIINKHLSQNGIITIQIIINTINKDENEFFFKANKCQCFLYQRKKNKREF